MLDDKQIRAARALLDWSQTVLAEKSGIARATIKNIENQSTFPRLETAMALERVFERAGVEFLPGSGVRFKDRMTETYDGLDANKKLVEDIYDTLKTTGGEILIAFLNETRAYQDLGIEYLEEQTKKRELANITSRLLISPKEKNLVAEDGSYRILPEEYFSAHPFFIYGPKLALLSPEPVPRVVIIKDERFAESATKLFNFIWDRTEMPAYRYSKKIDKE